MHLAVESPAVRRAASPRANLEMLPTGVYVFPLNYWTVTCSVSCVITWLKTGAISAITSFAVSGLSVRAYLGAWGDELASLPEQLAQRKSIQAKRVIDDQELFALQRDMPMTYAWHGLPELTWDLLENHYLHLIASGRTRLMPEFESAQRRPRLLIISHDIVDVKMAGPGMRYLEMARALKADLEVLLAVPADTTFSEPEITFVRYSEHQPADLRHIVDECDVVLVSSYLIDKFPFLGSIKARTVVDLYNPTVLENLNYYIKEPLPSQESLNKQAVEITNNLVKVGDYFICGNERQRDFWIGVLSSNGRINPRNYERDPSLYGLIDIVGVGFPEREPRSGQLLKGIHPRIPVNSRIVLWGGGIWDWLDPLTLIQAWPAVLAAHPEVRLVFLGTRHPNPQIPQHIMTQRAISLAEEIGQKDQTIIFLEWSSYEDREIILREADIGVTLHPVHAETRYSVRTRVMDYLWAMLPTLITEGDTTSQWVQEYELGMVVPPNDPGLVAKSLIALLDKSKSDWVPAFQKIHDRFSWGQVVNPLREVLSDRQLCCRSPNSPTRKNDINETEYMAGSMGTCKPCLSPRREQGVVTSHLALPSMVDIKKRLIGLIYS